MLSSQWWHFCRLDLDICWAPGPIKQSVGTCWHIGIVRGAAGGGGKVLHPSGCPSSMKESIADRCKQPLGLVWVPERGHAPVHVQQSCSLPVCGHAAPLSRAEAITTETHSDLGMYCVRMRALNECAEPHTFSVFMVYKSASASEDASERVHKLLPK